MAARNTSRGCRLSTPSLFKCFGSNKHRQPRRREASVWKQSGHANHRESILQNEKPTEEGRAASMPSTARGHRSAEAPSGWRTAWKLFNFLSLIQQCVPALRKESPNPNCEDGSEKQSSSRCPGLAADVANTKAGSLPEKGREKNAANSGNVARSSGANASAGGTVRHGCAMKLITDSCRPRAITAVAEPNLDRAGEASGTDEGQAVDRDSFTSAFEECDSLCAFGCQYGDGKCTVSVADLRTSPVADHLDRMGNCEGRKPVSYPSSIRAHQLQRRVHRFRPYFEEFLELEHAVLERT